MAIIAITLLLWFCSILMRAIENQKKQKTINRIDREVKTNSTIVRQLEREQRVLAEEQRKQAEQLAKHEKRIADLEFRMEQAEGDIEFLNERIANLDAQRDYLLLQQSATVVGGKEHTKYQSKIISIENQIHTAENKLNKAKHIKAMAEKEIEVA